MNTDPHHTGTRTMEDKKDARFILIVGTLGWFADSARLFTEKGYDGYFVRTKSLKYFDQNFANFASFGFKEIRDPFEEINNQRYPGGGVVISGNQFDPHGKIYKHCDVDEAQLAEYWRVGTLLRARGVNLLAVRMVNGDTFFADPGSVAKFEWFNRVSDLIVADSANVERYVKTHCAGLHDKRFIVSPVDVPLGRFATLHDPTMTLDYSLHSGRIASTGLPEMENLVFLPQRADRPNPGLYKGILQQRRFSVAGDATVRAMDKDRADMNILFGPFASGIGHFYDWFHTKGDEDIDALYKEMVCLQSFKGPLGLYELPRVYRLTNTPSKVLMYLMLGIPPVIPADPDNSFHKDLMDRDMCIPVGRDGKIPTLTHARVGELRRNIRAHTELFTFNTTFQAIDDHRKLKLSDPGAFTTDKSSTVSIGTRRDDDRRFVLVFGTLSWFADSLRIFAERGYRCFYFRTEPTWGHFAKNYEVYRDVGFTETLDPAREIAAGHFAGGIIISGSQFDPISSIYDNCHADEPAMKAYLQHSAAVKAMGVPTLCVRFINGDTFVTDPRSKEKFQRYNGMTDLFVADNVNLVEYVKLQCPKLRDRQWAVSQVEAPLKRFVHNEPDAPVDDFILHLGRPGSTALPETQSPWAFVPPRLDKPNPPPYHTIPLDYVLMAGGGAPLNQIERDRTTMQKLFNKCRGGIGHFYDAFTVDRNVPLEEILREPVAHQDVDGPLAKYTLPRLYRLTNTASKVVTYLMLGIPPIIPDDRDGAFYRELIDRDMCVPVKKGQGKVMVSDEDVRRIRRNIVANMDLFTFDSTFEKLDTAATEMLEQWVAMSKAA
jgi:hypothetical protein